MDRVNSHTHISILLPPHGPFRCRVFGALPCADAQSPHVSVVSIGASNHDLGIVLHANVATAQLFGYPMSQVVRRNISLLMPSLIGKLHDSFLRRYLSSGSHSDMRGVCSMLLAQHASGHLFPIGLSVQDSMESDDDAGAAAIGGHMDALPTTDAYVLLDNEWRVRGVSVAAEEMTGVSPVDCTERTIRASDLVCDWDTAVNEMLMVEARTLEMAAASSTAGDGDRTTLLRDHVLLTLRATEPVWESTSSSHRENRQSSNSDTITDDAGSVGANSGNGGSDSDDESGDREVVARPGAAVGGGRRGSRGHAAVPSLPACPAQPTTLAPLIGNGVSKAAEAAAASGSQTDVFELLSLGSSARTTRSSASGAVCSVQAPLWKMASSPRALRKSLPPLQGRISCISEQPSQATSRRTRARGSLQCVRLSTGTTFYVLSMHFEVHHSKDSRTHTEQQQGQPLPQSNEKVTSALKEQSVHALDNHHSKAGPIQMPRGMFGKGMRATVAPEPQVASVPPHPIITARSGGTCPFRPAPRDAKAFALVGENQHLLVSPAGINSLTATVTTTRVDVTASENGVSEESSTLVEGLLTSDMHNLQVDAGSARMLPLEVSFSPADSDQLSGGQLTEQAVCTPTAGMTTPNRLSSPGGRRTSFAAAARARRASINSAGGEGARRSMGGPGSVASTSATSDARTTARLRHALSLRQAGGFTVISLKRLYDVMRIVLLANVVIIAVMTAVLSTTFNNYAACMDISRAANTAVMATYNGMMLSRWAAVDSMGWGTGLSPLSNAALAAATQTTATVMRGALDSLSAATARLGGDATAALTGPVFIASFDNAPILPFDQVSEDAFTRIRNQAALLIDSAATGTVWPVSLHGNQTGVMMGTIITMPLLTVAYAYTSTLEALAAAEEQGIVADPLPAFRFIVENGYSGSSYHATLQKMMLNSYL